MRLQEKAHGSKRKPTIKGTLNQYINLNQFILENVHELVVITRLSDLTYEYVNPATINLLGYTQEELFSISILELVHPDDIERVANILKYNLPAGKGHDEFRYRKKDGTYVWLEVSGTVIPQQHDEAAIIFICRDITERRQMEEALQKAHDELENKVAARTSQLRQVNKKLKDLIRIQNRTEKALQKSEIYYRTIFASTGAAMVITDGNLQITAANLKTEQLTGYKPEELIGLNPFEDIITPEYLPAAQKNYQLRQLDPSSAPQDYEVECLNRWGEKRRILLNVMKIPESDNLVASMIDISDQHRDQLLLKASEERFRTLIKEAPLGVNISRNERTMFVNKHFVKMFGYNDASEIIGTLVVEQVAPNCRKEIRARLRNRIKGNLKATFYESQGQRQDGSTFPVLVQVNVMLLPDGPANVAFLTDITALKKAETTLHHQIEAQNLLLDISKHFANIVTYNIDAMISLALQQIGEFDHSDRSYVFLFSDDGLTLSNTHEWCAAGIKPKIDNLQNISGSTLPWLMKKLHNDESIYIPRVADLPPEAQAAKEILQAQDIKSLLVVPIIADNQLLGYIGFDSVQKEREWSAENKVILESVALIIAKGLHRKAFTEALAYSSNFYQTIFRNTGAATMIIEEDQTVSQVNEQCGRLMACPATDLIGRKWTEFVAEQQVQLMVDYHHQRRTDPEGAPKEYAVQIVDMRGKRRVGLLQVDIIPGTSKSVATFVDQTEVKRLDRALKSISAVNAAMVNAEEEQQLLEKVCKEIVEVGGYNLAWVAYLEDTPDQSIKIVADAGHNHGYTNKLNINLRDPKRNKEPVGKAIRTGKPVVCRNIKADPDFKPWVKDALRRGFKSAMAIPLLANNHTFGALSIYSNKLNVFDKEEQDLLIEMADDLAFAINSLRSHTKVKKATEELEHNIQKMKALLLQAVASLGIALDLRDPFTFGHQRKVIKLATAIASEMGLSQHEIEGIAIAANLHDIGKMTLPSEILSKPGRLTEVEFAHIKTHPLVSYQIIKDIDFPWPIAEIVYQHHERINGSGYPRGFSGEEILIEARIIAVADVVEAMSSHRPYRPSLGIEAALEEIEFNQGILYDNDVSEACLRLFREKGFVFD